MPEPHAISTPRSSKRAPGAISTLEQALGHRFVHPELLSRALTHRSQAYEAAMDSAEKAEEAERQDNERLEFLGDAVLGLLVAEALYQRHPGWQEGELTRVRAQLVSRRHMAEVAQAIGLGEHLRLGKGEERSGGRRKSAILANAMEAVLAAMYLDGGPEKDGPAALESVRCFAQRHILGPAEDELAREMLSGAALGDHKSALQQYLQASHAGVAVYVVESESGPDHRKRFQVEVRVKAKDGLMGDALAHGTGTTKKKAEQEAARRALSLLARGLASPSKPEDAAMHAETVEEPAEV
jgi:ribonuclease-3